LAKASSPTPTPAASPQFVDTLDAPDKLPRNYQLVIYELPTAWALSRSLNAPERAVATFLDVAALIDERIGGANFGDLSMLESGEAYLADLGSNRWSCSRRPKVLKREWGQRHIPLSRSPRLLNRRQRIRELAKSAA